MGKVENRPGWAAERWWETSEYVAGVPLSRAEINAAVQTLERYFDADWWTRIHDNPYMNIVAAELSMKGLEPLHFMAHLGKVLALLEGTPGFSSKIGDLKGEKCASVLLEFEIASIFARAGYDVSFPAEGERRIWDVTSRCKDGEIAIECKCLESEQWEIWADNLTSQIIFTPPIGGRDETFIFQIDLNPRLADLRLNDETFPAANAALREEIVRRIQAVLTEVLSSSPQLPLEVGIPGIGRARILAKDGQTQSSVTGCEISSAAKVRRIFTNGVLRGCEQLPKEKPGIIVVYFDHLPEPELSQLMLDVVARTQREQMDRVVAALLLPTQFLLSPDRQAVLVLNRHSPFSADGAHAIRVLREAIDPVVVCRRDLKAAMWDDPLPHPTAGSGNVCRRVKASGVGPRL